MSRRRQILLDCLILFLGTALLVRPYFLQKFTSQWSSIESTFAADARFLAAHFPHPQWQPLWYCGTRFDYIYPPAVRYGSAILSMVTHWWPIKAYHFYTTFFYCLGVAGVYLLVRVAGRLRGFALMSAAAFALMSPCFFFFENFRKDADHLTPLRLGVLLRYGEGPHVSALSIVPFAMAFAWLALERRSWRWVALSGVACAAVVSTNFYGATALVVFYPLLLWSHWLTRRPSQFWVRAIAIPGLAYALTALWLTPSYLQITSANMRFLPHPPSNAWSLWVALVIVTAFVCVSRKLAAARPDRTWPVYVTGLVLLVSLNVLGEHYLGFVLIGDPHRFAPELDLVLILGVALLLEWLWRRPHRAAQVVVAIVVLLAFLTAKGYVRRAWRLTRPASDYTAGIEYRLSEWFWKNMPDARVSTNGSVRFWFDTWHDLSQHGGGSEQGLINPVVADAQWEISQGIQPQPVLLWLQALGVDALYFSGPRSEEPHHDYARPERFAALPVLFDDGRDNRVFGIPRRYAAHARIVETARIRAQAAPANTLDLDRLRSYVDTIESGPDAPITLRRPDTDSMIVQAKLQPSQSLLVQESWDPAWHASAGGKDLPVRKDPMGFMLVDAPPGDSPIALRFVTPPENRIGQALTVAALLSILSIPLFERRRRRLS